MKKVENPEFASKGKYGYEMKTLDNNRGVWFEVEIDNDRGFRTALHNHFGSGMYSVRKTREDGKYYVKVEEE